VAETNIVAYPRNFASSPVTSEPRNIPIPVTALFTPRYFPSNPCGILLKNITELEVLKIENAITIRQDDAIVIGKPEVPVTKSNETTGIITAKIRGICANIVDLSSPNFDIIFGAMKKTNSIVAI
jgi:hypothetical protein